MAQARSGFPSPFKSAATTKDGPEPTGSTVLTTNPPLPLLVSTVTVLSEKFASIKSGFPSPLTSAVAMEIGDEPTSGAETRIKSCAIPHDNPDSKIDTDSKV